MKNYIRWALVCSAVLWFAFPARSQSLGNAGTGEGSVVDPSGAVVVKAEVNIHNAVTGYSQSVLSGAGGNWLHAEGRTRLAASVAIDIVANKVALYNVLSTFRAHSFINPERWLPILAWPSDGIRR